MGKHKVKRNARYWTTLEEDYLRRNFYDTDMHIICAELNRTERSVLAKANKLGLESARAIKQRLVRGDQQKWMPDEIAFLEEHYVDSDWDFLCKRLGRTQSCIASKAQAIGLYKAGRLNTHTQQIKDLIAAGRFRDEMVEVTGLTSKQIYNRVMNNPRFTEAERLAFRSLS